MRRQGTARHGFTLLELLVVIAIIGVLLALLIPAVMRVRAASARVGCLNNLKQVGLALHQSHDSRGALPPGCSYQNGADPQPHMSWCTRVLPFLEQEAVWREAERAFATERFFERPPHRPLLGAVMPAFVCPADGRVHAPKDFGPFQVAFTSYLGVEGVNQVSRDGLLFLDSRVCLADVRDGTSNTLLVGERPPSADLTLGWWYAGWGQAKDGSAEMILGVRERNVHHTLATCLPESNRYQPGQTSNQCDALHFWSLHPGGGANFLFADGSVRFLTYAADPVLPALATRSGGEPTALDQ